MSKSTPLAIGQVFEHTGTNRKFVIGHLGVILNLMAKGQVSVHIGIKWLDTNETDSILAKSLADGLAEGYLVLVEDA